MSAQCPKNRHGEEITLESGDIEEFATLLRGALIQPQDEGYDEARAVYRSIE